VPSEPFYASIPRTLCLSVDDTTPDAPITITALALPWGAIVDLNVLGDTVEFAAGSVVTADPARVPFLADHDNHPFGYGVSFVDDGNGLVATMAIPRDELADPRTASVVRQMRNGVRTAVSVGAVLDDVTSTDKGDHTHYVVNRGRLLELSSVVVPRFDDARVQAIAATANRSTAMPDPRPDPDPDVPDDPEEPDTVTAAIERHPAGGNVVPYRGRDTSRSPVLSLAGIASRIASFGRNGNPVEANRVLRDLTAAWTDVTTTTVEGMVRPQWLTEVAGLIETGAPAVAAFRSGTITSNPIMYPHWTALPTVGQQAAEKTAIPSAAVTIDSQSIPVDTYSGGNDVSRQAIDWSTPDFVAEYFRAATEMYARQIESVFIMGLKAAAGGTIAAATHTLVDILGGAIGAASSSGVGGGIVIVCSGDVYGGIFSQLAILTGSLFSVVNGGFPVPRIVVSPLAPAGTFIIAPSQAAVTFQSAGAPVRLQALDIPRGGVDLAVWGYFAHAVLYPDAVVNVTGYVPPVVPTVLGGGRSSKNDK
jgi:phage head maturation protease